jgi:hypothetical protein
MDRRVKRAHDVPAAPDIASLIRSAKHAAAAPRLKQVRQGGISQQSRRSRCRLHRSEYTHDPVRAARHIGAVSDADAGHPKLAQAPVDQPLILDIEVRSALVEE